MTWHETTRMHQRQEFVTLARTGALSMTQLCARFGISRKTGYKWLARADAEQETWSQDRSRRPHTSPTQTDPDLEALIIAARRAHPAWGGRKLQHWLAQRHLEPLPAPRTITAILHRAGLIDPTHPSAQPAPHRFVHLHPNDLWQMDYMGHLPTATVRLHPLTLIDDHARFALGLWACPNQQGETVTTHLTAAFRRYGLPLAILTDNGPPWGAMGGGGITAFEAWLIRLGIRVLHGQPYHPQTQGKVERLHRTIAAELTNTQRFVDLAAAQDAFDRWRHCYNHERPHHALDNTVPSQHYQPSAIAFPDQLPPIDYGLAGPDCQIRQVRGQGSISYQNRIFFISRGLIGQPVAVRPTTTDGKYAVFFCHQEVRQIDLNDRPKV